MIALFPDSNSPPIRSDKDMAKFQLWTGMSQAGLKKSWADRDAARAEVAAKKKKGEKPSKELIEKAAATLTSCNSFLSIVVSQVRSAGGLSPAKNFASFNLPQAAGASWHYYPDDQASPRPGDFFELGTKTVFEHVGVILDIDISGNTWTVVQGGQGGPTRGFDMIRRDGPQPLPHGNFLGWMDIDAYFSGWQEKKGA
jgi:hypothetical protein